MKILSTCTVFMIGASVVGTTSAESIFSTSVIPAMAAHHEHIQSRMLEVSQQCLDDTMALYNTTELATVFAEWEQDLEQLNFDYVCTGNTDTTTMDCILDSKVLSSHEAFTNACELVGGVPYLYSDNLSCKINESGMSVHFNIMFVDIPECIADTCNVNEVSEELASIADEAAQYYENELYS